jgi:diaminopimelate decarboxylase
LNLGGGYKVSRNALGSKQRTYRIGKPVAETFKKFATETAVEYSGDWAGNLLGSHGAMVSTVRTGLHHGESGHTYLKLDAGMTDVLRPSLYRTIHPITVLPSGQVS